MTPEPTVPAQVAAAKDREWVRMPDGVWRYLDDLEPSERYTLEDIEQLYLGSERETEDALDWIRDVDDIPADLVERIVAEYRCRSAWGTAVDDIHAGEKAMP